MKSIQLIYIIIFLIAFGSCQKVINVNLNSSNPRYVIEANIVDSQIQNTVTITKSVNFDQDNVFPTVSGAIVVITDVTAHITDTLKETLPGAYTTSTILGTQLHTYTLYVNADSNVFTATSTMPAFVSLDSIYALPAVFGNSYSIVPVYKDPPTASTNYYQFIEFINGTASPSVFVANDMLTKGELMNQALRGGGGGDNTKITDGNQVTVYFYCIDSATYQYFFTLQQTKNQNSATPANPLTNITGGALGYFSAHTSDSRSIVVP